MNTSFKVIGLTRLEIKPESTAQQADALTTRPSELLKIFGGACPRTPLESFSLLKLLKIHSAGKNYA